MRKVILLAALLGCQFAQAYDGATVEELKRAVDVLVAKRADPEQVKYAAQAFCNRLAGPLGVAVWSSGKLTCKIIGKN